MHDGSGHLSNIGESLAWSLDDCVGMIAPGSPKVVLVIIVRGLVKKMVVVRVRVRVRVG